MPTITDSDSFTSHLPPGLPVKKADWSDLQVRQYNRLLLEALCPTGLRQHRKHAGIETIHAGRALLMASHASPGSRRMAGIGILFLRETY